MKCHIITDFPEIFKNTGLCFYTKREVKQGAQVSGTKEGDGKRRLMLKSFDAQRSIISFEGIANIDDARTLCNLELFSTIHDSKQLCSLKEDEFFWFDLIGFEIVEDEHILGVVCDIYRLSEDYLCIGYEQNKTFLIPYIPHFIVSTNKELKKIFTQNAKYLKE